VKVLAALQRAEVHADREGVMHAMLYEHLHVRKGSADARRVREQLTVLVEAGSVERGKRNGLPVVLLTSAGRRRLASARRTGKVPALPESPQHRHWREAHDRAEGVIERFVAQAHEAVEEVVDLLDGLAGVTSARPAAQTLLDSRERLSQAMTLVASVTYAFYEWPEPDDAKRDEARPFDRGLADRW
jgi:hypothetical protein